VLQAPRQLFYNPSLPPSAPSLSVVVPTTHPWPAAKPCLNLLFRQSGRVGAEIVVAESTGEGFSCAVEKDFPGVRTVSVPGADVFTLRAKGTEAARGAIVAWTEDHCRPAEDWCERMLGVHAAQPWADAVGGAVINGSTTCSMDWSNFLCTFGPFVPPLENRIPRVPVAANVSFKRRAIPAGPLETGFMEFILERRLWRNRTVHFDDRILVQHVQSWGFWGTPQAHFHNGRSTTGLVSSRSVWWRLRRLPVCLLLPLEILRTAVPPLIGKPGIPLLRCLPSMTALAVAHSVGEMAGLVCGAGKSPLRLE
jgi:hypothetical protein